MQYGPKLPPYYFLNSSVKNDTTYCNNFGTTNPEES